MLVSGTLTLLVHIHGLLGYLLLYQSQKQVQISLFKALVGPCFWMGGVPQKPTLTLLYTNSKPALYQPQTKGALNPPVKGPQNYLKAKTDPCPHLLVQAEDVGTVCLVEAASPNCRGPLAMELPISWSSLLYIGRVSIES